VIKRKILITGTHTTPAIELINQLKDDKEFDWQIFYIGRNTNTTVDSHPSIESKIIPPLNVTFIGIDCGKFDRRWFPNTIKGIPQTIKSFFLSLKLLKEIKPKIIVSFGGYVSVPVIIASWLLKIPSITHEQTSTLSLSTRLNSIFATRVALSFPGKISGKSIFTGNLLRRQIFDTSSKLFSPFDKPIIFVTAGNQGSELINNTIEKILPELIQNFVIIHQTGPKHINKYEKIKLKNYYPISFIESKDIGWVLNQAKLLISRAGANTCREIVALKKPSILIPLKISQQNEQILNAQYVKDNLPSTTIVYQNNPQPDLLLKDIVFLSQQKPQKELINQEPNLKLLKLIKTI
jgi:UDP-N-acetylglucosamine--N-acetylmuramyl-(pentapeptide) pyrophosphoryl-undecaprenol N-acetylglucosamine transferase